MTIISPLPNTFVNGTVADATQVNSNFNQIVANVNANGAHNGANSDITSLSGLSTPLSVGQGGTGRTGVPCVINFTTGSGAPPAAPQTTYLGAAGIPAGGNETNTFFVIPVSGTLKNMYAQAGGAAGVANGFVYTLRKEQVDTALTCTTENANSGSHDTTHTVSVAAGDYFSVRLNIAAGALTTSHSVSFEIDIS